MTKLRRLYQVKDANEGKDQFRFSVITSQRLFLHNFLTQELKWNYIYEIQSISKRDNEFN